MQFAIWITGIPGSGKSTIAKTLAKTINAKILRLDEFRKEIVPNPTYSEEERELVYTQLAIKSAKLKVENDYEIALRKTGRAGDIFGLKNFGWKDQQDIKVDAEVKHEASQDLLDTIAELLS